MFTFPPSMWVANILYEHGHRLIASSVGFLTIIMAAWLWFADPRRWVRWFGVAALGSVVAQGLLGGLTVLFYLPAAISTAHAGLAEIFFCMTVAIALFTSPRWIADNKAVDDPTLRRIATTTTALIYTQILVGATMRHTGAGLAIPDFPWMFGHLVPDHWSAKIAIHFTHRVGALLVTVCSVGLCTWIRSRHRDRPELTKPAMLIAALVATQVTLGALTVLTARDVWINSFHVVCGALVLTTSLVITLRSWRVKFASEPALVGARRTALGGASSTPTPLSGAVGTTPFAGGVGAELARPVAQGGASSAATAATKTTVSGAHA
jgi:cytochrome c oxidase assembly protein subunit 15